MYIIISIPIFVNKNNTFYFFLFLHVRLWCDFLTSESPQGDALLVGDDALGVP